MTMYGANPEQLATLGRTLKQQIAAIDAVSSTVASVLQGTAWVGPARDRFEQEWSSSFRGALARLNEAFDTAGTDCIARSQELERVMGAR
jgi:hypothetical protein